MLKRREGFVAAVAGEFSDHVAIGCDLGVHLQKCPETVVSIHHPELAEAVTHQRHRLAAQIVEPFLSALLSEVPLTAAHLGQSHAHLGRLKVMHPDLDQAVRIVMIRNPVVARQVHTRLQSSMAPTLCRSHGSVGLAIRIGSLQILKPDASEWKELSVSCGGPVV